MREKFDYNLVETIAEIKDWPIKIGPKRKREIETQARVIASYDTSGRTYEQIYRHTLLGSLCEYALPEIDQSITKCPVHKTPNWNAINEHGDNRTADGQKISIKSLNEKTCPTMSITSEAQYKSITASCNPRAAEACDYTLFVKYKEVEENELFLLSASSLYLNKYLKNYIQNYSKAYFITTGIADINKHVIFFDPMYEEFTTKVKRKNGYHVIKNYFTSNSLHLDSVMV
jgi:hypothetical protein